MPVEDDLQAVRARRRATARSATGSRRTAAARRPTRAATPTGPSPTWRTCPGYVVLRLERQVGPLPAAHFDVDPLRSARADRARARRPALRRRPARRRRSRSPGRRTRSRSTCRARTRTTRSCRRFLDLGLLARAARPARAALFAALAGWTKFAPLLVAPLWLGLPEAARRPREAPDFAGGFAARDARGVLDPPARAEPRSTRRASSSTGRSLADRPRLAVLDLGLAPVPRRGHARPPRSSSRCSRSLLVAGALALAFVPRRKSPLQLAALTGALLIGFELVLTHWFYLYLPWFFPFVAFAVLAGGCARRSAPVTSPVNARLASWSQPASLLPRRSSRRRSLLFFGARGACSTTASTRARRSSTRPSTSATATRSRRAACRTATSGVEYPPGALPVFALPSLVRSPAGRLGGYRDALRAR